MTERKRLSPCVLAGAIAALALTDSLALGRTGPKSLREALNAYEASVEKLGASGSPSVRSQAIRALTILVSPRYPAARDRWAEDPSQEVRVAVLEAMAKVGDDSPEAKAIVLRSVHSDDTRIVAYALRVVRENRLRLDFGTVWDRRRPLTTWSQFDTGFGPPLDQVDGVASHRPWLDPAWAKLSPNLRLSLLARAGSRKAIAQLAKALEKPDGQTPRPWKSWVPAEAIDLPCLREMLDHPQPTIATLASFSLVKASDREHLARLGRCLTGTRTATETVEECSTSVTDEQVLRAALPLLDRDALIALDRTDPAKWFWEVQSELAGRGSPFTYAELEPRVAGLQPVHDYDPGRPYSDAERAQATYADLLKRGLIGAMIRESRYDALSALITKALGQPPPYSDLRDLNEALWAAPAFLASLPPDVAHANYLTVKRRVGIRKQEQNTRDDNAGISEALRTLGMMAQGEDGEELWRDLREAADPFTDQRRITPVVWGFTQRSEGLRRRLAGARRQGWFNYWNNFNDLLDATEPLPALAGHCQGRADSGSWDPFGLSPETMSLLGPNHVLSADLEEIYPTRDVHALSHDFLKIRGLGAGVGDPVAALELFWDRREPVRIAASRLFAGMRPMGPYPPDDRSSASSRRWYAALHAQLKGFSLAPPPIPGPALDPAQQEELEALVERERTKIFITLKENARLPATSFIACGGQPPTRSLVSLPYSGFVASTATYQRELRSLLETSDSVLRHGAAWALWLRFHDPGARDVFLHDSSSSDPIVRARALVAIQAIRIPEAAPLFPSLLSDASPELRQVGLFGVAAFRIRGSVPEVENLVVDENAAVAETAIEVLGDLRPPEASPLLIRLLGSNERLGWKAATSLARFRADAYVDALIDRLANPSTSDHERWQVLGVLTEVTTHPGLPTWSSGSYQQPGASVAPETIRDWQDWWKRHRGESSGERLRNSVSTLVERFLKGNDQEANMATWPLQRMAPELGPYTTSHPPTARERDSVERWWRDARNREPWTLLASSGIVQEQSLDLAMEIDPRRTRQQLIAALLGESPSVRDAYFPSAGHRALVRFAGVDFGDPALALCDARETIVADWLAWAGREGWTP